MIGARPGLTLPAGTPIAPAQAFINASAKLMAGYATKFDMSNCGLTAVTEDGGGQIQALFTGYYDYAGGGRTYDFSGNALDSDALDGVLAALSGANVQNCTIDVSGGTNASPDPSDTNLLALVGKGNTVTTNGGTYAPSAPSISLANIIAFWRMDEASGQTRVDRSGNGNDLTDNDGTVDQTDGLIGNAALFNSSNLLYNANSLLEGLGAFTIAHWSKSSSQPVRVSESNGDGGSEVATLWNNVEILAGTGGGRVTADSGASVGDNNWHLYIARYDGETLSISVDNANLGTNSASGNTNSPGARFCVGNTDTWGNGPDSGAIQLLALYSRAWTDTECALYYNTGAGMVLI